MNLIICKTPLQLYLAAKIIELYPDEDFYCISIYEKKTEKIRYYQSRLKCKKLKELKMSSGIVIAIYTILYRLISFFKNYQKVFVASIDSVFIHSILSSIKFKELYTFDDGTANIVTHGFFYDFNPKKSERLLRSVLLINYNLEIIKNCSLKHYTIFKQRNIINNTEQLTMFEMKKNRLAKGEELSIFIGQPLFLNDSENINLFTKIITDFEIDIYFPHPREDYRIPEIKYVETPLIFEDYLLEILKQNKIAKLYTIFSTAVLSFIDIEGVSIFAIKVKGFENEQKLMEHFGIELLGDYD